MATRRLPATPILVFQITVNHQTYIVYIHKHQCARETVVWEYKSSNVGINRFMLLLECVVTSSKQSDACFSLPGESPRGSRRKRHHPS